MYSVILVLSLTPFIFYFTIKLLVWILSKIKRQNSQKTIAFFHPYCNAGGGGERVLWQALKCVQENYPNHLYFVYTGDKLDDESKAIEGVKNSFNIQLPLPVKFVFLSKRHLLESQNYPYFTIICQCIASFLLAIEAILKLKPDVLIDTTGYSFIYLLFKMFNCKVISYIHYPTISTDMLQFVKKSEQAFNNKAFIARNKYLSYFKLIYYHLFAIIYSVMGKFADIVLVNSSWTKMHIIQLWSIPSRTHLVYPPCNTLSFENLQLKSIDRKKFRIISVAQFRPEKNHNLQLEVFADFLKELNEDEIKQHDARLILIGSVRNDEDKERVEKLKRFAIKLNIADRIEFKLNLSFNELLAEMQICSLGIHTMVNEHFGIAIVESMAAGLIMIAHNSGGPRLDIIENMENGFLACSKEEYLEQLMYIKNLDTNCLNTIRTKARQDAKKFSEKCFDTCFLNAVNQIFSGL